MVNAATTSGHHHHQQQHQLNVIVDVMLVDACCFADVLDKHGDNVIIRPCSSMPHAEYTTSLIVERWHLAIASASRRSASSTDTPPQQQHATCAKTLINLNELLQAMRSYLHFSQISSWLTQSNGRQPSNLAFSISYHNHNDQHTASGEHTTTTCHIDNNNNEYDRHTFPGLSLLFAANNKLFTTNNTNNNNTNSNTNGGGGGGGLELTNTTIRIDLFSRHRSAQVPAVLCTNRSAHHYLHKPRALNLQQQQQQQQQTTTSSQPAAVSINIQQQRCVLAKKNHHLMIADSGVAAAAAVAATEMDMMMDTMDDMIESNESPITTTTTTTTSAAASMSAAFASQLSQSPKVLLSTFFRHQLLHNKSNIHLNSAANNNTSEAGMVDTQEQRIAQHNDTNTQTSSKQTNGSGGGGGSSALISIAQKLNIASTPLDDDDDDRTEGNDNDSMHEQQQQQQQVNRTPRHASPMLTSPSHNMRISLFKQYVKECEMSQAVTNSNDFSSDGVSTTTTTTTSQATHNDLNNNNIIGPQKASSPSTPTTPNRLALRYPLSSSPAPIRKSTSSTFDFDKSLNDPRSIKKALNNSNNGECNHQQPMTPVSSHHHHHHQHQHQHHHGYHQHHQNQHQFSLSSRQLSTGTLLAQTSLLGSFEESLLNGRMNPVGVVDGFYAEIGASGAFFPEHATLPVYAAFYQVCEDIAASPYLGVINLSSLGSKRGYRVPNKGTIQCTLFNPNRTVVKMFVVMYDLSDMPANHRTFIRQRTMYVPLNNHQQQQHHLDANGESSSTHQSPSSSSSSALASKSFLRYLIHLRYIFDSL